MGCLSVWRKKQNSGNQNCRGLSLLEVAIVLGIIGLMVGTAASEYNDYAKRRAMDDSRSNLFAVKTALNKFFENKRRYPCPANPALVLGDAGYGVEICPAAGAPAPGACAGGVCRADGFDVDNNTVPDPVLIGSVPFTTLELVDSKALDGWNRKMSYAVTEAMTVPATFDDNGGAVFIKRTDGVTAFTVWDHDGVAATPRIEHHAHFIIVSHGNDGRGGFKTNGQMAVPCAGAGVDITNCDNDATYIVTRSRVLADPATYFDDFLDYQYVVPQGLWQLDPATGIDISFQGAGKVGIGRAMPQEKLDVNGNILANSVMADGYCLSGDTDDTDGNGCFSVTGFAGADNAPGTIRCDVANRQGMTGISNGQAECDLAPPAAINETCPPGQMMRSINPLVCVVP